MLVNQHFENTLQNFQFGVLEGLWACSVAYDCRIIFAFKVEPETGEDLIVLVDIGSHDEVY